MTGDGVNDAPALKQADVGIAVRGATDAARAAASLVLFHSGLSVIADAIVESRKIFSRMRSYLMYRVVATVQLLIFLSVAIMAFSWFLPPIHILLIALMNDVAVMVIAYDEVNSSPKPINWKLLDLFIVSTAMGIWMVFSSLVLLFLAREKWDLTEDEQFSLLYLQISVGGHIVIFSSRAQGGWVWSKMPSAIFVVAIVGTQILASIFAAEGVLVESIGWKYVGIVWGYCLAWFVGVDVIRQLAELCVHENEDKQLSIWKMSSNVHTPAHERSRRRSISTFSPFTTADVKIAPDIEMGKVSQHTTAHVKSASDVEMGRMSRSTS